MSERDAAVPEVAGFVSKHRAALESNTEAERKTTDLRLAFLRWATENLDAEIEREDAP